MQEGVVGSAGRRNRAGPWGPHPGPWGMALSPPRCEQGTKLFLPRKLASEVVLGTFPFDSQWQSLQGE